MHTGIDARSSKRKWLLPQCVDKIGPRAKAEGDVVGVDVLILEWGCFDDALRLVQEERVIASKQGDHVRLTELFEQEIAIVRTVFNGAERIERMSLLAASASKSSELHSIEAEIRIQKILHIEIQKLRFELTGSFDLKATGQYFKSEFYKRKIAGWPIACQVEKLHIDEANHIYRLDVEKAIEVASKLSVIYDAQPPTLRAARDQRSRKSSLSLVCQQYIKWQHGRSETGIGGLQGCPSPSR